MDPSKPLLIFDGDCGFCRRWIERWRGITGDLVEYAPYQEAGGRFPQIPEKNFRDAVQLVEPDGKIYSAAEAVFRSLAVRRSHRWPLALYLHVPGARAVTEFFYRQVARHRAFFSHVTSFFWGKDVRRPSYHLSSAFFLKALGLVYFFAFLSLATQITGLIGEHGIFPGARYLKAVAENNGPERYWFLPTLAWFNASDFFLKFLAWGGVFFSAMIMAGILPALFLFLSWFFYLSLLGVSGPFLSFQWDILLLETGFLAIFLAPPCVRSRCVSLDFDLGTARFFLKLLLFKLMFSSGLVKLASHDAVWKNLTALTYHYRTQPLPAWTSWYADHWPIWFQKTSCFLVLAIELGAPFFIFFPRRLRHAAAAVLAGFQLLIFATGNYNFFNLLTMALCLLLVEDAAWPVSWRKKLASPEVCARKKNRWPRAVVSSVGIFIILMNLNFLPVFRSFQITGHYGLFAVMTTERPEIIVEGSRDGKEWLAYEFKYKPGDVRRRPRFVEPFQPRLDWQMWFAALGSWRQNLWFLYFCQRLLEGSPDVLKLLAKNPFPDGPPRYIRALVYEYDFTTPEERKKTGAWWKRELKGIYSPVMSLKETE